MKIDKSHPNSRSGLRKEGAFRISTRNTFQTLALRTQRIQYGFSTQQDEVLNGLNEKEYLFQCSSFLESLGDTLEESSNSKISDVEVSDGVLKVTINNSKTFIINRQVPNRQIWYSSPISGPQRFNFEVSEKAWKNQKNQELSKLLFKEIEQL